MISDVRAAVSIRWVAAWMPIVAIGAAILPAPARAQDGEENPVAAASQAVIRLLAEGDYRKAADEATKVEASARPTAKDPTFLPRSKLCMDMLVAQGIAELRIGNLDAAEDALKAAWKRLTDRDFQRTLGAAVRAAGASAAGATVPLELTGVELIDTSSDLVLARMRRIDPAAKEAAETFDSLEKQLGKFADQSQAARKRLAEKFDKADESLQKSPQARVMAGEARPLKHAGLLAVERGRMAKGDGKDEAAAKEAKEKSAEAVKAFEKAVAAVEEAVAAAAGGEKQDAKPAAEGTELSPAAREAAIARAEVLEKLAEARRLAGDLKKARPEIDDAVAHRSSAQGRDHPDLVPALAVSARVELEEAAALKQAGDPIAASEKLQRAGETADRAAAIIAAKEPQFEPDGPLRTAVQSLLASIKRGREQIEGSLAAGDAVDAAAVRAVMAIARSRPRAASADTPTNEAKEEPPEGTPEEKADEKSDAKSEAKPQPPAEEPEAAKP